MSRTAADAFPVDHRTSTSGVPTFWTDGPGRFSAGLVFRVGRVDETLVTSGITHLVEHLALPLDRPGGGCSESLVVTMEAVRE